MTSVYFITDGEFIKIGVAKDAQSRLKELQTGNPKELFILKTIEYDDGEVYYQESMFHKKFARSRAVGEWFSISKPLFDFICDGCDSFAKRMLLEKIDDREETKLLIREEELQRLEREGERQRKIREEELQRLDNEIDSLADIYSRLIEKVRLTRNSLKELQEKQRKTINGVGGEHNEKRVWSVA